MEDVKEEIKLVQDYDDETGREGVVNQLYTGGRTMGEVYNHALDLAQKINAKWQKKRLLQIGMFEDLLGCMNIAAGYNTALESHLATLEARINKLQAKLPKESNEATPSQGDAEEATATAA